MKQQGVDTGDMVTLQWSGDLTIRRIGELKAQLEQALAAATEVAIDIAADAECDLTLLQLLCAAHRTASRQGKVLQLGGELSGQFQMVLDLAGFSRHIGCALDACGNCLWKQIYQQRSGEETACVGASN